jgi:hypothetical protein
MQIEEETRELLIRNVPKINTSLKLLFEHGLRQSDVVAILHNRLNKGKTRSVRDKVSYSTIQQVLREVKKLDSDVRGAIE